MVTISNLSMAVFMARSKRIALTLDPEYHELLKVIADYQGKKVTTVVKDFMNASRPMAEAMKKAFDELHAGKDHTEALNKLLKSSFELVKEKQY
ncbi:Uncharacterised protein [Acinetobacter baumannii]|nr:Uncharacterised protein [Acinetobacter baumannii]SSU67927.1 Uncharacterised protein [Acinetobacter baumannii]SSU87557.1 Uncharacterised protein [Acinetobacter baumannii]SSV47067.1 Uncharacterised protein [Acinetobacter baumannii]